jgi:leucyl-tRNA synthetase
MVLDLFAPHTAEEMWEMLGYEPFVGLVPWRQADPTLLVEDTVTAVVQIDGKVRATLEVPARIRGDELEALARANDRVLRALGEREIVRAIVRPPKVVSFSTR